MENYEIVELIKMFMKQIMERDRLIEYLRQDRDELQAALLQQEEKKDA